MAYGQLNISSINGSGLENNLLINPEFTVNQRGSASPTATSNAYNYDRWYYDGTYLYQGIQGNNLRATTYTLSWTGAMTASYSLNTGAASSQSGQSWTSVSNGTNITIASVGSNNLWIRFSAQPTQPKLELGTSQTTFVPRLYGQELALCQWYYWSSPITVANQAIETISTTSGAPITQPVAFIPPMRISNPTVSSPTVAASTGCNTTGVQLGFNGNPSVLICNGAFNVAINNRVYVEFNTGNFTASAEL